MPNQVVKSYSKSRPLCYICRMPYVTNKTGKYGEGGFNTCSVFCLNAAKMMSRMTR